MTGVKQSVLLHLRSHLREGATAALVVGWALSSSELVTCPCLLCVTLQGHARSQGFEGSLGWLQPSFHEMLPGLGTES